MTILLADCDTARMEEMARRCKTLAPDAMVVRTNTPAEALEVTKTVRLDLAVLNPDCVGLERIKRFHETFPKTELIFLIDPAGRTRAECNEAALTAYGMLAGMLLLPIDWERFDCAIERSMAVVSDAYKRVCEKYHLG